MSSPIGIPAEPSAWPPPFKKPRSILWKIFGIFWLTLALLIPLQMVGGLIQERSERKAEVVAQISEEAGGEQVLQGPVLVVPYVQTIGMNGKTPIVAHQLAYLLPEDYRVDSTLTPQEKHLGIYKAVVYSNRFQAQGRFDLQALKSLDLPGKSLAWKNAFIFLGVSNPKGIRGPFMLKCQNRLLKALPGTNGATAAKDGFFARFPLTGTEGKLGFETALSLKGGQAFSVVPLGSANEINIQSVWPSPHYTGSPTLSPADGTALPASGQKAAGQKASWSLSELGRGFPQATIDQGNLADRMRQSAVGLSLLTPVDSYRQSDRAIKYGILFLVLTFATYLLFEMITRSRLHPLQYLLVGCAISLFYLLLIALSEIIAFEWAYAAASGAIISLLTLYSKAILGRIQRHAQWIIGGLMSALYGYLYVLLQLEDLSLVFGAMGLLVVLSAIMYITRNLDWYSEQVA